MKRRFDKLLPAAVWLGIFLFGAKLGALVAEMFLPPLPQLECQSALSHPKERYPFAEAFGLKSSSARPKPSSRPAPKVSLRGYQLTMTAIGEPSMAIIVHQRKSRLLTVGETIDGFRLTEVYTDRVKLVKNGQSYWLTMKKSKSSIRTRPRPSVRGSRPSAYTEQIRHEGDTYYVPRELLEEMHDIKKIFKYISLKPIYRNNKMVGFGIAKVKKGSVFDKMGLRKRDIIEKIDGSPLTSETEAFKYFNKINELSSLSLTIKRGSEHKELHYEIF
ncbi:type II secretion system protein N [Hydrogenimonas urashimensis]|uniref:type II secretion system protein N n=1 Tax=Hydrogenimonas urashimensis TaxID=2740515 RepID=UPI0019169743|nr:PDZ domain-containing protein [Hydrogenimonas urashimensis]